LTEPLIFAPDVFATTAVPCVCTVVSFWLSVVPVEPPADTQLHA
jgi:hypothetical protein